MIPTNATQEAAIALCAVFINIYYILYTIAGAIGTVIITLQGIKWIGSAEDRDARKQAKLGIIHAIIGLIIVVLAVSIVQMVYPNYSCFNI